jgi:DNA-binding transcriptional LysR family regulator
MVEYDLRRLRLLRELQVRGTLGAVATALGYTPSAVSQQLAVLEREAGVRLLQKAGRGVQLTDAGRLLAQHADVLLSAAHAAQADLASLRDEVRGTVRAAGFQSATRRLLIPAVAGAHREHPQVRVELSELEVEQALPELRLGSLDLVISDEYDGHARPRPSGLRYEILHEEPLRLVLPVRHRSATRSPRVAIAELRDDVWVAGAAGTGHHALVISVCRSLGGYEPDLRHRSDDADVQLELIRTTGAVGLMPQLTLPTGDPALAYREVAGASITRRLVLITRDGPTAPALDAFIAAVHEQVRAVAAEHVDTDWRNVGKAVVAS